MRWIAHLDMDSFYVSVERLKNPHLNHVPLVVGGLGPRSVVSSSSYEARKFGVKSAMPIGQARRLCPSLVVVEPNFDEYFRLSKLIFLELEKIAPVVEQISVDEAYLDFTGCERLYSSREDAARKAKEAVFRVSGLTSTIGVSTNRLTAKISSDFAKPDGLTIVPPGTEEEFLRKLSIRKIPGVGNKTAVIFELNGVKTCEDLVRMPPPEVKMRFGEHALEIQKQAKGIDDTAVSSEGDRKSLSVERTFDTDIGDFEALRKMLLNMSEELCTSMREESLKARTFQIKMRNPDFSTIVRARTLREPTYLSHEVRECATQLLQENFESGTRLRLLGLSARNFSSSSDRIQQMDLFANPVKNEKVEKVEFIKDLLKRKFGDKIIKT